PPGTATNASSPRNWPNGTGCARRGGRSRRTRNRDLRIELRGRLGAHRRSSTTTTAHNDKIGTDTMLGRSRQHQSPAVSAFIDIMGSRHVLTSARATEPYAKGNRFGGGSVLAVLKPGSLVDMWRALQVCVDHDLIVVPQSANTGLTGGSGPGAQDYDREIVIISTLRLNQIHLINDAREAVCLAGSTLYELDEALAPLGREPHSVIGSSSIGASVIGGIANNSGGSQV